jgi:hypothetical protein
MKTGDGLLNARQAAAYVGYEPGVDAQGQPLPWGQDKAMRAFYAFVRRHAVETKRCGRRLRFSRLALDRAIDRCTDTAQQDRLERMAALGRQHARGEKGHFETVS